MFHTSEVSSVSMLDDLTPLLSSSQDLESLKEVKKGWKKQSVSQASLSLLPSDAGAATPTVAALVPEPERRKGPKTFTAFHKVWRRLEGPDSKFRSVLRVVFACYANIIS